MTSSVANVELSQIKHILLLQAEVIRYSVFSLVNLPVKGALLHKSAASADEGTFGSSLLDSTGHWLLPECQLSTHLVLAKYKTGKKICHLNKMNTAVFRG